jgi:hypothetical protein
VLASTLICHSGQSFAAQYEIKEISPLDQYREYSSMGINDSGTVVGIASDKFNFQFYNESYIENSYKSACGLSDSEVASGSFDASSTSCLMSVLSSLSSASYQKLGTYKSFISSGDDTTLAILSDVVDGELGDYTTSNTEIVYAINSNDIAVGTTSAPFIPVDFSYTNSNNIKFDLKYWEREYKTRAAVYLSGSVSLIEPTFSDYGGLTSAVDISDSGYVAGYSSTSMFDSALSAIESDCISETEPLLVCVWGKQQVSALYATSPYIWQVDSSGNVLSSTEFGLGLTVDDSTSTSSYTAVISAVNDEGIGVGYGHVYNSNESVRIQPLVFVRSDKSTESLIDNDLYDAGYASDINNSNVVVGKVQTYYDGTYNDEFFVYDMATEELQTPDTFYTSAESSANAINDLGKVIGEAEYEVTTDTVRRKHGFIYDINTKEFFDINDLVECNSEFEIVEMKDINNSNQIAATALKTIDERDSLGEVEYDTYGEPYKEQVTVSVLLTPIESGEIENCSDVNEDKYERKGLSSTPILLIFLSALLYIRRRSI